MRCPRRSMGATERRRTAWLPPCCGGWEPSTRCLSRFSQSAAGSGAARAPDRRRRAAAARNAAARRGCHRRGARARSRPRPVRGPGERRAAPRRRGRPRGAGPSWTVRASTRQPGSGLPGVLTRAPSPPRTRRGAARPHVAPRRGGRRTEATLLPTGSVRLPPGTRVTELPGYAARRVLGAGRRRALPARLLAARPGERIADLCAAPGGKTAQLAAAGAEVIAVERDPARIATPARNLARLRPPTPKWWRPTPRVWRPAAPLDAVLLDAPCSATGTIRRHPDVPLPEAPARPRSRSPPGRTGCSTPPPRCSDPADGWSTPCARCSPRKAPARVAAALARTGLRHDPFTAAELAALPEARTPEGYLRTHPGLWPERGGMDGFFAARSA